MLSISIATFSLQEVQQHFYSPKMTENLPFFLKVDQSVPKLRFAKLVLEEFIIGSAGIYFCVQQVSSCH